jgi:hypothetical protein
MNDAELRTAIACFVCACVQTGLRARKSMLVPVPGDRAVVLRKSRNIKSSERKPMSATKIVGILLIVLGCLGLAYGGFSYNKETTEAKLGSLELKVREHETVNVPAIASAGAIAIGIFLLVAGRTK